jgi:hypothetical protein
MTRRPRGSLAKRPTSEWAVRGGLTVAALLLAYASLADTLANVAVKLDPARAHRMAPDDGKITAALAEQRFTLKPEASAGSEPARLARLALAQDATAVGALSVLGLQAQLRGETDQARRLFAHSLALSRRELRPRIWAIEEAVSRGDIREALRSYDVALRTSRRAPDLLFPVLASAIGEPKVRAALLELMKVRPSWEPAFIEHVRASTLNPGAAVLFFDEGARAGLPVLDRHRTGVVNNLLASGSHEQAWSYYSSFRRGAEPRRSRDPNFAQFIEAPAPFDWIAINSAGVSASVRPDKANGMVEFAASPTTGGAVLQQMQMLPVGSYRLSGRSSGIEQPDRSLPYWALACSDGRELGRVVVPNSADRGGAFSGTFEVPSDCPIQTLTLVARASDELGGVSGEIHRAELAPIGRTGR